MPYLKEVLFNWERIKDRDKFPFNIPSISGINNIVINSNVTYFIGENGSGKSTLLEAIALKCGFGVLGGGKNNLVEDKEVRPGLEELITLSWMPRLKEGFFLRAETFFNFANYLDELSNDPFSGGRNVYSPYGGKSLNEQSHGEAFLSLFLNRFHNKGIYILDEPEAALSPQRQLAFIRIMWQLEQEEKAQFIIATHSPILMAYPNATIFNFEKAPLDVIDYEESEHYQLTKNFLNDRESFLKRLLVDE